MHTYIYIYVHKCIYRVIIIAIANYHVIVHYIKQRVISIRFVLYHKMSGRQ